MKLTWASDDPNGEIDENFWAQAAADRVEVGDEDVEMGKPSHLISQYSVSCRTTGHGVPIPFESQFFHDDGDDGFAEDNLDMGTPMLDGDDDDLWQGTQGGTSQGLKKSRPENVNYAKKAKRVDVKRLKDDIWTGLKTLLPEERPASSGDDSVSVQAVRSLNLS